MRFQLLPTRLSRGAVAVLAGSLLAAVPIAAQSPMTGRLVFGAFSPTGEMKEWYGAGGLGGLQGTWRVRPWLNATGTMYWANTHTFRRDRLPDRAIAWTYDLGLEGHSSRAAVTSGAWSLVPFVGAGFGSRSYYLPKSVNGSTTGWGGFGSLGADLGADQRSWGLRLEGRVYRGTYTDTQQSISRRTGTDYVVLAGLSYRG